MSRNAPEILNALERGEYLLSIHAASRMTQRCITKADIRACARTAVSCCYQPERRTYRVRGQDFAGEPLTIICGIEEGVIIVTLFQDHRQ